MLASPGCSPRLIASAPSTPLHPAVRPAGSEPPPPKRLKNSQIVLDEDAYVAAVERIIERDFFPDIPKLQNRLQWLEAVKTGDPALIREAQLNIIRRRMIGKEGGGGTPASLMATPASIMGGVSPAPSSMGGTPSSLLPPWSLPEDSNVDTSLSLDAFLNQYTSEDNASFSKIIEKVNKRRREKYDYLEPKEQLRITDREQCPTDGYGTSGQAEGNLDMWKHTAKNLLMYDSAERGEAALTLSEKEERLKALTKEVKHLNTRFHAGRVSDLRPKEEGITSAPLYSPLLGATPSAVWRLGEREAERGRKKYDLEDLRKSPQVLLNSSSGKASSSNGTASYGYVHTPSPAPGVEESPFITWGEIAGTPLRLDDEEEMLAGVAGSENGPCFKIPAPTARDARAHSLSRNASRNLRERSRLYQSGSSPSPARDSRSPALKCLSAAAQNFMRKAMAKSASSVDPSLRASYSASPGPGSPSLGRYGGRSREGSVVSREGSVPQFQSPSVREASVPLKSP